ncbi:MAG: ATP-binding cassette domain-containing protein [Clostridia bacterium]|nr:ATP-binding cassette domain-containing protein [Clostridia bacterium]
MLEIRKVTRKFGAKYGVRDAELTIEPGHTYALLGPNGSGKTTLMKMIAGLMMPTSGEILLDGVKIGPKTKAKIAYMPTESYFYNYMTIMDAGRYYRDFFRDFSMARYQEILQRMDLNPKDKIAKLSSGMNAKVRLALTLSRDAELLMFDEPLNGVDILTRTQVINEIIRFRAQGRSMIISTHLVEEMDEYIDRVVFMKHGEVALQGIRSELTQEKSLTELYLELYAPPAEPAAAVAVSAAAPAAVAEEVAGDA